MTKKTPNLGTGILQKPIEYKWIQFEEVTPGLIETLQEWLAELTDSSPEDTVIIFKFDSGFHEISLPDHDINDCVISAGEYIVFSKDMYNTELDKGEVGDWNMGVMITDTLPGVNQT